MSKPSKLRFFHAKVYMRANLSCMFEEVNTSGTALYFKKKNLKDVSLL